MVEKLEINAKEQKLAKVIGEIKTGANLLKAEIVEDNKEEVKKELSENAKKYYEEIKSSLRFFLSDIAERYKGKEKLDAVIEIADKEGRLWIIIRACNDREDFNNSDNDTDNSLGRAFLGATGGSCFVGGKDAKVIKAAIKKYDPSIDTTERGIYFDDNENLGTKEKIITKHLQIIATKIQKEIENTNPDINLRQERGNLKIISKDDNFYLESYGIQTSIKEHAALALLGYKMDHSAWDYYSWAIYEDKSTLETKNEEYAIQVANLINFALYQAKDLEAEGEDPFYFNKNSYGTVFDKLYFRRKGGGSRGDLDIIDMSSFGLDLNSSSQKLILQAILNKKYNKIYKE